MALSQSLLPEFDHEVETTRKVLARVPDDKFGWKPHEKSMLMGNLASHIAHMLTWSVLTVNGDSFDMNPPDAPAPKAPTAASQAELLELFDKNAAAARDAIAGASDEQLFGNWSLLLGGNTLFTMPRIAVLRSFVMNHIIHHRGQLSVYLRLNDVPVPSIYGPSADESPF